MKERKPPAANRTQATISAASHSMPTRYDTIPAPAANPQTRPVTRRLRWGTHRVMTPRPKPWMPTKTPRAAASTSAPPGPCSATATAGTPRTAVTVTSVHSSRTGCARRPRTQSSAREAVTMHTTACVTTMRDSTVASRGPTWP